MGAERAWEARPPSCHFSTPWGRGDVGPVAGTAEAGSQHRWEPHAPESVEGRPGSGLIKPVGPRPCPAAQPSLTASPQTEELLDLIASSQSRRLDDQRASVGSLPGLRVTHSNLGRLRGDGDPQEPGDEFFNMLIKCQVGLRLGKLGAHPRPPRPQGAPACLCQADSAGVARCLRVLRPEALLPGPQRPPGHTQAGCSLPAGGPVRGRQAP